MSRVLVVAGEESLRGRLIRTLEAQGLDAHAIEDAAAVEPRLHTGEIDAMVLDLDEPAHAGWALAARLARTPGLRLMLVASRNDGTELIARQTQPIAAAIQAAVTPPNGATWSFDRANWRLVSPAGAGVRLTATESSFLELLMQEAGRPCGRNEIAEALGRDASTEPDRSIDAMVRRLRRKVGKEAGLELPIRTVYGVGYVFTGEVGRR